MNRTGLKALSLTLLAGLAVAAAATADGRSPQATAAGDREQHTQLISVPFGAPAECTTAFQPNQTKPEACYPDGPSTNAVISADRRWSRVIAFESQASNLVPNDTNGQKDVFAVPRAGTFVNDGSPWSGQPTVLVSRTATGEPANGPSFGVSLSGDFRHDGGCIAFLSGASNLVPGDTNGKVDAFLVKQAGAAPQRVSLLPGGVESTADTTEASIAGDCSRVSFVTSRKLYTRKGTKTTRVSAPGRVSDPSYATGNSTALVFTARRGIYLSPNGIKRGKRVTSGGRDAVFNDLKRRTLAYEKRRGGKVQIFYKDLGKREQVISARNGTLGNGHSLDPVIGNSGYYVTFESDASNLGVNALERTDDHNGRFDSYLYTNVRNLTLVQSVEEKAVPLPGGGANPSMSYYANYVLFDSPGPLGSRNGNHQIYMRYLGPV
jgi:hypothetical protein